MTSLFQAPYFTKPLWPIKIMKTDFFKILTVFSFFCFLLTSCQTEQRQTENQNFREWQHYMGDPGRTHYSSLEQINKENVQELEVAWVYHSGDADPDSYIQGSPIVVGDVLYGTSPRLKVFAVDAATGKEIWKFDPFAGTDKKGFTRGISHWKSGEEERIFFTAERFLYALDARTGKPAEDFGTDGKVDLSRGLGRDIEGLSYSFRGPGTIHKDLIIMGALTSENLPAAPGHIRAFDVRSGAQQWIFHTIPQPGEMGHESWEDSTAYQFIGGANNWSGLTLDEERGILFAPLGSASFDFYGGNRKGANLFANCLLALEAETGKYLWHFQAVHHDLWDRDLPTPPSLLTVEHEGKRVDVVAQPTKTGHVYVFERETGKSLFPIEEKPYPASDLKGEEAYPTQPLPLSPPPFSRQELTVADINPYSPDKDSLIAVLKRSRSGGQFVPPSTEGTVLFPGFDGGAEWGGAAVNPDSGMLYVNANEMPWILSMIEIKAAESQSLLEKGKKVFQTNCMSCHGIDLKGSNFHGNAPALVALNQRLDEEEVLRTIRHGRGEMPSFAFLEEAEIRAVSSFLLEQENQMLGKEDLPLKRRTDVPYRHTGYNRFVDADGYPAVKPPWGTLNAIDLNKGTIVWQVPLGEFEELTKKGIPPTGTENYGGPVLTAGGLLFIGATMDGYFRAFDKDTGKELWKHKLPAAGMATPAIYEVNGRQYVVIAAGGGKNVKKRSDAYVAFALPEKKVRL